MNITTLIHSQDRTIAEIAAVMHLSDRQMYRLIAGDTQISLWQAVRLAAALNLEVGLIIAALPRRRETNRKKKQARTA